MLFRIVTVVAALAIGAAMTQTVRLNRAQAEAQSRGIELVACGARLNSVIRDIYRDTNIDRIPDDALRAVPPEWLHGTD